MLRILRRERVVNRRAVRPSLASLAGDLRDELWSHLRDEPLDPADFRLERAYDWLNSHIVKRDPDELPDAETLALAALALQSWNDGWIDTDDGFATCNLLIKVIGPCDHIPAERAWAAAMALRVFQHSEHYREYRHSLASGLADLAHSQPLDPASASQVIVSLRLSGEAASAPLSLQGLVGSQLEGADPYHAAQVVWAAAECGDLDDEEIDGWRDFIGGWLNGRSLHHTNHAEACACVQAMAASREPGAVMAARVQAERILNQGRALDGSWYESTWETAWSLLATHSAHETRWIIMSAGDGDGLIRRFAERLADQEVLLIPKALVAHRLRLGFLAVLLGVLLVCTGLVWWLFGASVGVSALGSAITIVVVTLAGRLVRLFKEART